MLLGLEDRRFNLLDIIHYYAFINSSPRLMGGIHFLTRNPARVLLRFRGPVPTAYLGYTECRSHHARR